MSDEEVGVTEQSTTVACAICAAPMREVGTKVSAFSGKPFAVGRCAACGFGSVLEPRTDFAELYDERYYGGHGADPLVDYLAEMADPRTVRRYEWEGIRRAVGSLTRVGPDTRWLDYGCGLGGLVRHLRAAGMRDVHGFEEGFAGGWMEGHGIPHHDRAALDRLEGTFDVITAIEVVEHVPDPMEVFAHVARLLAPGGVFFLTTGNARPVKDLAAWPYVIPDVHVSFFEPRTVTTALERVGLRAEPVGLVPGFEQIIRYKVLKTLRWKRVNPLERVVPWRLAAAVVDRRHAVSEHPMGRKP